MRTAFLALAALTAAAVPQAARAQFFLGGHVGYTTYQGGGMGGGAQVGLDLPVLPVDIEGNVEWFSPSCDEGRDDCSLRGATLDANIRLPLPLVRPYLTGGLSYRDGNLGGDLGSKNETGVNAGVGIDVNIGIRIYGDYRYEFLDDFEGAVLRAGLIFNL
jgi:hypothetical protein